MKKLLIAIALCSLFCTPALAQDTPAFEIFGGYQLVRHGGDATTDSITFHGFDVAGEGNITDNFSIVGEFGATFKGIEEEGINVTVKNYTFLVGPRFGYRAEGFRPFAHVLVGLHRFAAGATVEGIGVGAGINNFGIAFGGGVDIDVNENISIRPAQVDLLTVRFSAMDETDWENVFRYSAGVVLKF